MQRILTCSTDDCLYLYFICTEKFGKWPSNNDKCTEDFETCCVRFMEGHQQITGTTALPTNTETPPQPATQCHPKLGEREF